MAAALVKAAPDGMMMVGEGGEILLVNRRIEELSGYRREDLVVHPVEVLLPGALRRAHRAHRTGFRADGAMFPLEISLSPCQTERGQRVLAAVRDITARVAAEREGPSGQRSRRTHVVTTFVLDRGLLQGGCW